MVGWDDIQVGSKRHKKFKSPGSKVGMKANGVKEGLLIKEKKTKDMGGKRKKAGLAPRVLAQVSVSGVLGASGSEGGVGKRRFSLESTATGRTLASIQAPGRGLQRGGWTQV